MHRPHRSAKARWLQQQTTPSPQQSGFNLMNNTGTEVYYNDDRTVKGLSFWKSLVCAPLLILFFVFQRQFMESFMHSGIK